MEADGRGPLAAWLSSGPTFSDPLLVLQAAAQGLGIALVPEMHAADMVEAGQVVAIGSKRIEGASPYRLFVNCQPEDADYVELTVEWICAADRT
jgi:DNA-binding transcriptional LysR family regulator